MKTATKIMTLLGATVLVVSAGISSADVPPAEQLNEAYATYQQLVRDKSFSKALPYAEQALELGVELFGEYDEQTAVLTYNHGALLLRLGRYEEARTSMEQALQRYEQVFGEDSPELRPALWSLGRIRAARRDLRPASRYLKRALKLEKRVAEGKTGDYAEAEIKAGVILLNNGGATEAYQFLRKGHAKLKDVLGEADPRTGYAAFQLGRFHLAKENHKSASRFFAAALGTFKDPAAPSNQLELTTHAFLVQVYEEMGDSEQATQHCLAIGRMTPFDPDQEQIPLYKRPPEYPMSALQKGQEGSVIVEFSVDENGFVKNPVVVSADGGKAFHSPALEAVRSFRYAPRFEGGEPVQTSGVKNKISFKLAD